MLIDPPVKKTCLACEHWQIHNVQSDPQSGYAMASCHRPIERTTISVDFPITRASDYCSGWERRKPPPPPYVYDPFGY